MAETLYLLTGNHRSRADLKISDQRRSIVVAASLVLLNEADSPVALVVAALWSGGVFGPFRAGAD